MDRMNYFYKAKVKQFSNIKNFRKTTNNGGTKSVLKPITQSNINTQELESLEKPNILDIESNTMQQPKSVTKLLKPMKQPKIITQKPNKINVYTDSKAADCTL